MRSLNLSQTNPLSLPQSFRLQAVKARAFMLLLLVVMMVLSLNGCASVSNFFSSPTTQAFAPEAINLAVAAAVGTNKATVVARAQKIKDIASQILAADQGGSTSLATINADLNAKLVGLRLPPADLQLAQGLASAFEIGAMAYLASKNLTATATNVQVATALVLNQVITEAKAFGAV